MRPVKNKKPSLKSLIQSSFKKSNQPRILTCSLCLKDGKRWNTCCMMLKRFIQLSPFITVTLLKFSNGPNMLTSSEMQVIKDALMVLEPLLEATENVSGEKYSTASLVIPMVSCLKKAISEKRLRCSTDIGKDFVNKIIDQIDTCHLWAKSTLLDARFKKIHFSQTGVCANMLQEIKEEMGQSNNSSLDSSTNSTTNESTTSASIWNFHDKQLPTMDDDFRDSSSSGWPIELRHYIQAKHEMRITDPLMYWLNARSVYPILSPIAVKYLGICATSVPTERLFSKVGNIITTKRNRLKPSLVSKLLFLNSLDSKLWK